MGDASDHSSDQLHRLEDIEVKEVSLVDRAANKRTFLVVKRSGEMAEETKDLIEKAEKAEAKSAELQKSLDEAQAEAAKLKAEAADTAAADELQKSLDEAQAEIAALKEVAEKKEEPKGGEPADEVAKLQKSLGESVEKIAKLQERADEAAELAKSVASLEKDKSDADHAAVRKMMKDEGKLPPSLEEWADKQTADELRAFAKGAPTVLSPSRTLPATSPDGDLMLTGAELKVTKLLGITTEEFTASRKAEIKKQTERDALAAQ